MSSKERSCPKCSTSMEYRLGEFDCPSCGHRESAAPPKVEHKKSGPGFKSQQQWGGSSGRPQVPPGVAPPPASGTVYSPEVSHSFGREEPTQPKYHSSLQIEKNVYFALVCVGSLFSAVGGVGQVSGGAAMSFAGSLVSSVVGLLVLAYVIYGSELWAKQCCMACTGFQLLSTLGSIFFINSVLASLGATSGVSGGPLSGGFAIVFILIGALSNAWLLWILYRDAQYLS